KYDLDLDSQGKTELNKRNESFDSNQDRSLPLVKVDSGLYFDRDTTFAGTPFRQTLEPRAMYLYVPYKDQDSLPVFDTSEPSFSYDSLWR
ncbi:LPS assembly protein LptD, partial [Pseudomonas aeruginosa]|uniref:LPS assembly protein LptD n=3 Tax=Pseudomonas TaxID=286 RepID=UPI000EABA259